MPRPYTVRLAEARDAFLAELTAFQAAARSLDDLALLGPSRAHGWSRLDCLVHVRLGLQEMLAGIPARTDVEPDVDAASYWSMFEEDADPDSVPGILMTRRVSSAYVRPTHALAELEQVAAGLMHAVPAIPDQPVAFQGHVISAGDLLATWAVELAVHHHDLDAPAGAATPTPGTLQIGRLTAEALREDPSALGLPADDLAMMLAGFGRAEPQPDQASARRPQDDERLTDVAPSTPSPHTTAIRYVEGVVPAADDLRALYDSVSWSAYTDDMDTLVGGVRGSAGLVTAWQGDRLVGLARVVSDGFTIAYLQDVLIHPDLQRRGIATELLTRVFAPFQHARQHVLITDTEERQRAFYESLGFRESRDVPHGLRAFVRFQRG